MAFNKDYNFGLKKQDEVFPRLVSKFGGNIKPTTDKMDPWDYISDDSVFELKSRNNTYSAYPTTLIGLDKVKEEESKKMIFLFNFTDGLYWIEYDKDLFDTFGSKKFRRYRPGVNDKVKPYLYIPIEFLKKIE